MSQGLRRRKGLLRPSTPSTPVSVSLFPRQRCPTRRCRRCRHPDPIPSLRDDGRQDSIPTGEEG